MKRLLWIIMFLFLFTFVSSTSINDVKVYNETTKTVEIYENSLATFPKLTIRLDSELNKSVGLGYQEVAEFTLTNYDGSNYNSFMKELEFYDLKRGNQKVNRDFDLKYKTVGLYPQAIYNETEIYDGEGKLIDVNSTFWGYEIVKVDVWTKLTPAAIMHNQILTIGLFTDVKKGDVIEWIPTFSLGKDHRIVEWATWTADLNTNLVAYYKFDNNYNDSHSDNEGVPTNSPPFVTGIINNGTSFTAASSQKVTVPYTSDWAIGTGDFASNFWYKSAADSHLFSTQDNNPYPGTNIQVTSTGVYARLSSGSGTQLSTADFRGAGWQMMTYQRDGTNVSVWINGTYRGSTSSAANLTGTDLTFAWLKWASQYYTNSIDEASFWVGRSLNETEIQQLWNGGAGISYTESTDNPPTVELQTPANNTNYNTSTVTVYCLAYDDINLTNVTFVLDSSDIFTNTTGLNNTNYSYTFTSLSNANHTWTCRAEDNSTQTTTAAARWFNVSVPPILEVTLNTPADEEIRIINPETYYANFTDLYGIVNASLWTNESGWSIVNTTYRIGSPDQVFIATGARTFPTTPYLLNTTDTHGLAIINGTVILETENVGAITNFTTEINYVNGTQINNTVQDGGTIGGNPVNYTFNINSPVGVSTLRFWGSRSTGTIGDHIVNGIFIWGYDNDTTSGNVSVLHDSNNNFLWNMQLCDSNGRCNMSDSNFTSYADNNFPSLIATYPTGLINYFNINNDSELLWNVSDDNLDTCWYDYNNVNSTVTCADNQTTFTIIQDYYNLTFYANDSFGNTNSSLLDWEYRVLEIERYYPVSPDAGDSANFIIDLEFNASATNVTFNYDGTTYLTTAMGTNYSTALTIPGEGTYDFYWNITYDGVGYITTDITEQVVAQLVLDNCTTSTNLLFNFSLVDEELQTPLSNVTIEAAINIYDSSGVNLIASINNSYPYSPLAICLGQNLTVTDSYLVDGIIRYYAEGYAIEYYNVVNYDLNSTSLAQNITLYDLNLSDSTEFQLTFKGTDFLPVEGALVYVDRRYISENIFKTVELPLTDANGQTIIHLVRNDIDYNIRFVKDGEVLATFENIRAFCQDATIGSCYISLNAVDSTSSLFNYNEEIGLVFSAPPYYNDTSGLVSFTYSTTDGTAKTVRLEVTRNDVFGNRSICNSTLVSAGGTLSCSVPTSISDAYIDSSVYIDGILGFSKVITVDDDGYPTIGYVIWFVLTLAIVILTSDDKKGLLIGLGISTIIASLVGLSVGGIIGLGAAGVWIIILVVAGLWKLNKETPQ